MSPFLAHVASLISDNTASTTEQTHNPMIGSNKFLACIHIEAVFWRFLQSNHEDTESLLLHGDVPQCHLELILFINANVINGSFESCLVIKWIGQAVACFQLGTRLCREDMR